MWLLFSLLYYNEQVIYSGAVCVCLFVYRFSFRTRHVGEKNLLRNALAIPKLE
jgi:hypothetical protein